MANQLATLALAPFSSHRFGVQMGQRSNYPPLSHLCAGGSTIAAARAVGYAAIGIERDPRYFELAQKAIPKLGKF